MKEDKNRKFGSPVIKKAIAVGKSNREKRRARGLQFLKDREARMAANKKKAAASKDKKEKKTPQVQKKAKAPTVVGRSKGSRQVFSRARGRIRGYRPRYASERRGGGRGVRRSSYSRRVSRR